MRLLKDTWRAPEFWSLLGEYPQVRLKSSPQRAVQTPSATLLGGAQMLYRLLESMRLLKDIWSAPEFLSLPKEYPQVRLDFSLRRGGSNALLAKHNISLVYTHAVTHSELVIGKCSRLHQTRYNSREVFTLTSSTIQLHLSISIAFDSSTVRSSYYYHLWIVFPRSVLHMDPNRVANCLSSISEGRCRHRHRI